MGCRSGSRRRNAIWKEFWRAEPPDTIELLYADQDSLDMLGTEWRVWFGFRPTEAYREMQAAHKRVGFSDRLIPPRSPSWFAPASQGGGFEVVEQLNETGRMYLFLPPASDPHGIAYMVIYGPGA